MGWTIESPGRRILRRVLVIAALAFFLLPLAWLLLVSFQAPKDVFAVPPRIVFQPTLDNYASVLSDTDVGTYLRNSIIIAAGSTMLSLALGVPAAYALAWTGSQRLQQLAWISSCPMVPPIADAPAIYLQCAMCGCWARTRRHRGPHGLNSAFVGRAPGGVRGAAIETERQRAVTAARAGCLRRVALPLRGPASSRPLFCICFSWNIPFALP